jgi:protease YdgD
VQVSVLLVSLLIVASQAGADTPLKRLTLRSDGLGWEAVGRLDLGNGYCSGVLIATDLVLTAGHCVYDRATGAMRPLTAMRFRAGLDDGSAIAEEPALRSVVDPVYADPATSRANQIVHDVAIVQLRDPIPAATAAPFLVGDLPVKGDQVAVVSYARGRSNAQSWQQACMVKGQQGPLIAVSCDVTFGSSGAPIFSGGEDRPRIVSLVSSGGMVGQTKLAFGMALPQEVALLQSALRSGQGEIAVAHDATVPGGVNPAWNGTNGAKFVKP